MMSDEEKSKEDKLDGRLKELGITVEKWQRSIIRKLLEKDKVLFHPLTKKKYKALREFSAKHPDFFGKPLKKTDPISYFCNPIWIDSPIHKEYKKWEDQQHMEQDEEIGTFRGYLNTKPSESPKEGTGSDLPTSL